MRAAVIRTEGLTRRFGDLVAVEDLSFAVGQGEVVALLGPNGAGKTTTVRMLACLIAPTSGRAWVAGREIREAPDEIRAIVGILTETPGLYRRLSAWQNLRFFAELYGVRDADARIEEYLRLFGLWGRRREPVATLSKGMRQKLALARALLHEPQVLLLDEPTAGLDPESARSVREFIAELRGEGRAILLCTHNLPEAERLCDRIVLLRTRLIAAGTAGELKRRLFGTRVVVELANPRPGLEDALRLPGIGPAELAGGKLYVGVEDPRRDNPRLIKRLVELGAEIVSVREEETTLEDVYHELMGGADAQD
ncbi:MAG: ABC transporter ATP-binding protein [Caldiserica bacterium]|nr:ABC transporter ATP-binding protein [Caldisericota bacterium]